MIRAVLPIAALTLALAACDKPAEAPKAPAEPAAEPAPTPPPAAPTNVLPASFVGAWDVDGGECGLSDRENRLVLQPAELTFYESGGDITAVRAKGADAVEVDAAMSGEGEEWNATLTFTLSEGGATLTTTQAGVEPTVRHRCQQPEG